MTNNQTVQANHFCTFSRASYMACVTRSINERWKQYDAVRHSYAVEDFVRGCLSYSLDLVIPGDADGSVHFMPSKGALMNHLKAVLRRLERDPDYQVTE
jgi:hypothetical protein